MPRALFKSFGSVVAVGSEIEEELNLNLLNSPLILCLMSRTSGNDQFAGSYEYNKTLIYCSSPKP